jgi:hypothetical protein
MKKVVWNNFIFSIGSEQKVDYKKSKWSTEKE